MNEKEKLEEVDRIIANYNLLLKLKKSKKYKTVWLKLKQGIKLTKKESFSLTQCIKELGENPFGLDYKKAIINVKSSSKKGWKK